MIKPLINTNIEIVDAKDKNTGNDKDIDPGKFNL